LKKLPLVIISLCIFFTQTGSEETGILIQKKIKDLSLDEYFEMYYDLAMKEQVRPDNFAISRDTAQKIFEMLVKEYYDTQYTEDIIIREYKGHYIITGSESDSVIEIEHQKIIRSNNSVVTMILRIVDGTIIGFFMER